ncbi:MAG: M1 family peptidase, partial [Acidimicrobiia bacterium]|nr:M1 family peptidase [Acidimicrobiia bacterium]
MLDNPHRLPRSVIPRRYEITIEPDLSSFTFRGSQIVAITVEEATDLLILNAAELAIEEAFITNPAGERLSAVVSYDEQAERAHLSFTDRAPQGSYELHLSFAGTINDQLRGFYRSTFTDVDGVEQTIATTQFEATDARRAFPCWDEPDFKATFSVSLIVPSHLLAVSNGREIERHPLPDGRVKVVFAETMRMSTYLVAYVVGPLEATDAIDVDGVPLRIIAPKGKHGLTQFALEAGEFCLRYLVAY